MGGISGGFDLWHFLAVEARLTGTFGSVTPLLRLAHGQPGSLGGIYAGPKFMYPVAILLPGPGIGDLSKQAGYMGQELLNPPSVEGWHTGVEWINSGSLMKRINFVADMLGDTSRPGVRRMIGRLQAQGNLGPEELVDRCLELVGPVKAGTATLQQLVEHVAQKGELTWDTDQDAEASTARVSELLQLIASVKEYQYC